MADRIVAVATPLREVVFHDAAGRVIRRIAPGPIDSPYPASQNLEQWRTEAILADALEERGVVIERSRLLTGATEAGDGVVAEVERGGEPERIGARFLIGADGARSAVRHALGARMEGADYPERWIAGELRMEDGIATARSDVLFDEDRMALRFPIDGGYLFFATLRDGELDGVAHGPIAPVEVARLYTRTFGRFPHLEREAARVPWSGVFTMHHCALPEYRRGRIFLAGDAAHLTSAAGGNGMNAGIQDAVNLAWRLAAHLRLGAEAGILDGYTADRHEMFEWIEASSDAAHRLLVAHDPSAFRIGAKRGMGASIARLLRGATGARAAAGPSESDRALGETSFAYTRDPAFTDLGAADGALRAGMRVPPLADLSAGCAASRPWSAIHDGYHWTLVVAVPSREGMRGAGIEALDALATRHLRKRVRLVVAAGEAFAWNAPRPTVYLVRPDGHVAFRCDAEAGALPSREPLAAWLGAHFPP